MALQLCSLYMFSYTLCGDGLWFLVKLNDSLEPVQFELFSKQIGGGAKVNIFQYSMILFSHDKIKGLFLVLRVDLQVLHRCCHLLCIYGLSC